MTVVAQVVTSHASVITVSVPFTCAGLTLCARIFVYTIIAHPYSAIFLVDDVDMSASPDLRTSVGGVVGHTDSDGGESEDE